MSEPIDPAKQRPMPPTSRNTGRVYHGLPDSYPCNMEGFVEAQAASAKWVIYEGISPSSQWHLKDGTLLELWPGGSIFNEYGSLVGNLRLVDFGALSDEAIAERSRTKRPPEARGVSAENKETNR